MSTETTTKNVYFFGKQLTEGSKRDRNLLGGKGANLAEMTQLGIPVPPGFTITTDECLRYYKNKEKLSENLIENIKQNITHGPTITNHKTQNNKPKHKT